LQLQETFVWFNSNSKQNYPRMLSQFEIDLFIDVY